jgi:signal-transduction protein with cAMP-binding, CBS, and nucleotidyltransferase domain
VALGLYGAAPSQAIRIGALDQGREVQMPGKGMGFALAVALAPREPRRGAGAPTLGREGANLLAEVPLFSGLSNGQLRRIAALTHQVRFPTGALIIQAGQPGRAFFVLVQGNAKVTKDAAGSGRALSRLGAGDVFGEFALLDGGPRTASVLAESPVVALRLSRSEFRRLLAKEPKIAVKMLEGIASRARTGERIGTE